MANPIRGEVAFFADGEPYTLQFTTDALVQLEDRLDQSFAEIAPKLISPRCRLKILRAAFWAGLIEHTPHIQERPAGELMRKSLTLGGVDGEKPATPRDLVLEAIQRAFPKPREDDAPQGEAPTVTGEPAADGISKSSSASGASSGSDRLPTSGD